MISLGKIPLFLCVHGVAWVQARADSNQWPWKDAVPPAGAKIGYIERIVLQCPISERTAQEKMGRVTYRLLVRGNTVVAIDPPGRLCPLFQREYLRDREVRWRKVQRFVAEKQINY
jgi:hypothetical protein